MSDEEVNRLISEFMGWKVREIVTDGGERYIEYETPPFRAIYFHGIFTESLDALVPVWEKLRENVNWCIRIITDYTNGKRWRCEISPDLNGYVHENIAIAAAYATAQAILELKDER